MPGYFTMVEKCTVMILDLSNVKSADGSHDFLERSFVEISTPIGPITVVFRHPS